MTKLELTLINSAQRHQDALAAYYPKHQAKQSTSDEHAEYLNHSHALTELVSLAESDSGLSEEGAVRLREIRDEDAATFRQYFPADVAASVDIAAHSFQNNGQ